MVGLCWGFTTPFIRRAALTYTTPAHPSITDIRRSWFTRQVARTFFTILGLLKSPGYAVPLLCNVTGSVWFFLLVGKAGEHLAFAFLFHRSHLSWEEVQHPCLFLIHVPNLQLSGGNRCPNFSVLGLF